MHIKHSLMVRSYVTDHIYLSLNDFVIKELDVNL